MSRYMAAINLLIELLANGRLSDREKAKISRIIALEESPGEQAIREGDEMAEEMLRMNGF